MSNSPGVTGELRKRLLELEARVAALERLMAASAPAAAPEASPGPPTARGTKAKDIRNWRKLKSGMCEDQVRALLGEPRRVSRLAGCSTTWYYHKEEHHSTVEFGDDGLDAWDEPEEE
jgi:outer membrane protein assembly factor BamE (lipoprotein component of BamABCDE complex)